MANTIYKELDPFFEIINLLSVCSRFDELKKETKDALLELGYDGEKFYEQNLKVYDIYVETFKKHMVISPDDLFFFEDDDSNYFKIILSLFINCKDLITTSSELDSKAINKEIINTCIDLFDIPPKSIDLGDFNQIIQFLDSIELAGQAKWKIMRIMQDTHLLVKMVTVVNNNFQAYKKAANKIDRNLSKLVKEYHEIITHKSDEVFNKFKNSLSEEADIYPAFALPLSQLIFEKSCYYGLICNIALKNGESNQISKELLKIRLKALSDKSKLEILSSLKNSPKYNLEIAEQLGLTAATMSHHMNVLLTCGFVSVKKQNGRVYYHLEKTALKQFLEDLEQLLL